MTSLGSKLLLTQGRRAKDLLRRVVSRRRGRCELGLVSAMVNLLQQDKTLYGDLCPHVNCTRGAHFAVSAAFFVVSSFFLPSTLDQMWEGERRCCTWRMLCGGACSALPLAWA